jgi:Xaa-Pro dipeptidase
MIGKHPYFPMNEFEARMARIRASLAKAGVAVGLFDEIEAMAWLTGYGNSENRWRCVGLPVEGEPFWLIRALDAGPCRERSAVSDITSYLDWEDPSSALANILAGRGLAESTIGVEYGSPSMTARRLEELKVALPRARFIDLGPLIAEARLIKSQAEIELLRKAASIADEALRRAALACRPGGSQRDAAQAASAAFIELGAEPGAPGPISSGRGWDFLHGHMSETPLSEGDVVHIELTPRVLGYTARIMRCVSVGRPAAELLRSADTLAQLQDRQIAAMRPGALASDIDAILRKGVIAEKLRPDFQNITGYTLGYYSHATTHTSDFTRIFHPKAEWRLESGMVFHMYVSAAGASFSETVLVGGDGPELLTRTPRTILVSAV